MTKPIPRSVLRRRRPEPYPAAPEAWASSNKPARSVLRRPDPTHPFAPFVADDLALVAKLLDEGFDPFWFDERGRTCAMECASRGHFESLSLALTRSSDGAALAALRSDDGFDAFDFAAMAGSMPCMSVLAKHLPASHRGASGHGFMWHAVDGSPLHPGFADAWLASLCSQASSQPPAWPHLGAVREDAQAALARARELLWTPGAARLEDFLQGRPQAHPLLSQAESAAAIAASARALPEDPEALARLPDMDGSPGLDDPAAWPAAPGDA